MTQHHPPRAVEESLDKTDSGSYLPGDVFGYVFGGHDHHGHSLEIGSLLKWNQKVKLNQISMKSSGCMPSAQSRMP